MKAYRTTGIENMALKNLWTGLAEAVGGFACFCRNTVDIDV